MPGFSLGFGFSNVAAMGAAGPSYSAEATAYFAAMSVAPDATRKGLLDALIVGLKSDGVWAKLDWLSITAAHDAQAGRVNAVTPAQVATAVNSPTFTTDRGYTGDGTTSYLNSGWNPTTATTPKMVQNSASMGVWLGTDSSSNTQDDIGTTARASIDGRRSAAATFGANLQSATNDISGTMSPASSVGFSSWSRYGAASAELFKNGVSLGTKASTTNAPANGNFFLLAANNVAALGTPTRFSPRRSQAAFWGEQLSAAEHLALYNRLATYMTAIGA